MIIKSKITLQKNAIKSSSNIRKLLYKNRVDGNNNVAIPIIKGRDNYCFSNHTNFFVCILNQQWTGRSKW